MAVWTGSTSMVVWLELAPLTPKALTMHCGLDLLLGSQTHTSGAAWMKSPFTIERLQISKFSRSLTHITQVSALWAAIPQIGTVLQTPTGITPPTGTMV